MKYYVIAGEASGDLHGSRLIREIKIQDSDAQFRCWGGDRMQKAGGVIVKHYRDLAFMGFLEVILNIRTILKNIRDCKKDILSWRPDAIILVDYPGFNMRIAQFARDAGFKVIYYIAPQMWAWNQSRVHKVHKRTDLAFVVLPFEKEFHAKFGYHVEFVGHPLLDSIDEFKPDPNFRERNKLSSKPIIAIVPGSRKQEISRILPIMASVIPDFPDYQFIIAGVSSLEEKFYRKFLDSNQLKIITGQTYDLLSNSEAALVTSGTATLETGLLGTPQVVCYKMSFLTALLAWIFIKVEHISLVNLVLGRTAVTELIQYRFTRKSVGKELGQLLKNPENRRRMMDDYDEMREKLGKNGASAKASKLIVPLVKNDKKL
ncbi:MAG: lipid-A-disaccharide synthase [Bacteroidetes bacterium]|nr:lipid-A-disaccharide synthase [Bacteroidota bacterium]